MAITINSTVNPSVSPGENSSQPSAPLQAAEVNVDLDNSYPAGGYDLSASFSGAVVVQSQVVPHYDGTELRWFKVYNDSGTPKLMALDTANGAPGAETTPADDMTGHTGLVVPFLYK